MGYFIDTSLWSGPGFFPALNLTSPIAKSPTPVMMTPSVMSNAIPFVISPSPFVISTTTPFVISTTTPFVISTTTPFVISTEGRNLTPGEYRISHPPRRIRDDKFLNNFRKSSFLTLQCIIILLILLPYSYALSTELPENASIAFQVDSGRSESLPENNAKMVNPALVITVENLAQQMKQGRDIALVDIRSAEEFNQARIPGSLNIPLHFIRTKMFLKQTDVVLITDGYQYNRLESECRKLKDLGFKVSILSGGLNYWKHIKGPFEGDMWAHSRFDMVTPHAFNLEKDYEHWVVIDVSMDNTLKDVIPGAVSLPVAEDQPLTPERMQQSVKKQEEPCQVLFVSEQGRDYECIQKIVKQTKLKNVFYLEGGAQAYREFLDGTSLSHKPKDQRIQEIKKCPTCG